LIAQLIDDGRFGGSRRGVELDAVGCRHRAGDFGRRRRAFAVTGASTFAASVGASGFIAASAGAMSLMLGGGRSALSGIGTAAVISVSVAAKAPLA